MATDALLKLTRYFRTASIMHYPLVMPNERGILHHRRGEGDTIETSIRNAGPLRLDPPGPNVTFEELFAA